MSFLSPLPLEHLAAMARLHDASIDESLRIPPSVQLARVLVETTARDSALTRKQLLASRQGDTEALESLHAKGVLWPKANGGWALPWALELAIGEGARRGPRSFASLYAHMDQEAARAVARGRGFPWLQAPRALSLETLWGLIRSPTRLAAELSALGEAERDVLVRVGEEGGEVTGHELADLERNPSRVATTSGVWSRRGASFSLNRRGLLLPMGMDRHIVPEEVVQALLPSRVAAQQRAVAHAEEELASPADAIRAQYTHNPGHVLGAIALLALAGRSSKAPKVLPSSRMNAVAARLDTHRDAVSMLYVLAYEAGWLRASAGPPLTQAAEVLARLWLRSSAWDESFEEPDRRRVPEGVASDGAIQGLRELVLEHVRRAAVGRWVRVKAIVQAALSDPRSTRLCKALARRKTAETWSVEQTLTRIVTGSLHYLGELDIADSADGTLCRRATRSSQNGEQEHEPDSDRRRLHVRASARVCDLAATADLLEPLSWDERLSVTLHEDKVREAFVRGMQEPELEARLALCLPSPPAEAAGWRAVLARGMSSQSSATASPVAQVIHLQDASIAFALSADAALAPLLVAEAPPGWLFVRDSADVARVLTALRMRGVAVGAPSN